ncbi:MAG: BrnA antitoxin family protein [Succinivibrio sp.]|nr:BrnA antitoxin family protein [Succinivibrio sp.]
MHEVSFNFVNTDFSDCPVQTADELKGLKPRQEVHDEFYRPVKRSVHLRLDADVLAWFKAQGKGYQTRINKILRDYAFKSAADPD